MFGNGADPAEPDAALGDARDFRQLLLGDGGQHEPLHDTARYLGWAARGHGDLGAGLRLWVIADGDLAGYWKSRGSFWIYAGVLAGGAASVWGLPAPALVQSRHKTHRRADVVRPILAAAGLS